MTRHRRPVLLGLLGWLSLCAFGPAACRAEDPRSDLQAWSQLQLTADLHALSRGFSVSLESTARRGSTDAVDPTTGQEFDTPLTYVFVRPSITYDLAPWFNATLGYAWAPVYYDEAVLRATRDVREHRVWEQGTFSTSLAHGLTLASRLRVEERIRTSGPGKGDVELRLRERVRGACSLVADEPWQAVLSDELLFFLNETDFDSEPGFSENRAFIGLGYKSPSIGVELGYLNQFTQGKTRRVNHVLSTSLSLIFGPSKS